MSLSSMLRSIARTAEATAESIGNVVQGLNVVDSDGNSVCLIGKKESSDKASAILVKRPDEDFGRANIQVAPDGRSVIALPYISGTTEDYVPGVEVNMSADGRPAVALNHGERGTMMVISFDGDGLPFFGIQDSNGTVRAAIDLQEDESPRIALFDENGKETWAVEGRSEQAKA